MEETLVPLLLAVVFINTIYLCGKFLMAIFLGVHEDHLFLGFGKHSALSFQIKNLKISIGLFIPLPWLAKFYNFEDGRKERIRFEWEYFDLPIYKRLLVIFGGSLSMLIVSMVIFSVLEHKEVDRYISKDEINKYGIYPSAVARNHGFEKGDKIISINGSDYNRFSDLFSHEAFGTEKLFYGLIRDQDTIRLYLTAEFVGDAFSHSRNTIFNLNAPFFIKEVLPDSRAEEAGLLPEDIITEINRRPVLSIQEFSEIMAEIKNDTLLLTMLRNKTMFRLEAVRNEEGKLGFYSESLIEYSTYKKTLFESIRNGVRQPFTLLNQNLTAFKNLFVGEIAPSTSLSGPVRISSLFGSRVINFFKITAMLFAFGAFYEFLPFPRSALLRSVPLIIEKVGYRVSYKRFVNLQRLAWLPIASLIVWNIVSDILRIL